MADRLALPADDATVRFGVAPAPVPTADRTRAGRMARARRAAVVGAMVAVGLVVAGVSAVRGPFPETDGTLAYVIRAQLQPEQKLPRIGLRWSSLRHSMPITPWPTAGNDNCRLSCCVM